MTQALFVDTSAHGIYPQLLGAENCWGVDRDARSYRGPEEVVAHPPCQLWTNMAHVNYKRYPKPKNKPGNDDGMFAFALAAVRRWGGVLEHPKGSRAWDAFALEKPTPGRWGLAVGGVGATDKHYPACAYWIAEVCQATYGHKAQKMTWLLYAGRRPPFDLNWQVKEGTHQIGWFDRIKPTLGKREASATPPAFAELLIRLARWSRYASNDEGK